MVAGQCCYYVVGDLKLRRCRQKPGPKDQPISETAGRAYPRNRADFGTSCTRQVRRFRVVTRWLERLCNVLIEAHQ